LLSLHGVGALTVEMVLSVPHGSDGAGMILIVKEGTRDKKRSHVTTISLVSPMLGVIQFLYEGRGRGSV
jgi:hypothetical protein